MERRTHTGNSAVCVLFGLCACVKLEAAGKKPGSHTSTSKVPGWRMAGQSASEPEPFTAFPTFCPTCDHAVTYLCPNLTEALVVCSNTEARARTPISRGRIPS